MKKLSQYILIKEQLEDNLYWKLDQWFHNNEEQKQQFIDIVSQCRVSKPDKSTINFMLNNIKKGSKLLGEHNEKPEAIASGFLVIR